MQKTNKSLLFKVLTVLCALCFTLVLAFGLVGCANDQVAIVGSDLVNGKLVLTYSDGTTKEYDVIGKDGQDGQDGKDYVGLAEKCTDGAEHDLATTVIKYGNCKDKGINLVVCSVCKGFKAVETEKNPELHGEYVTELISGPDGQVEVPVLVFNSYETATDDSEVPTCTESAHVITACSGCGEQLADETVPALDHKLADGSSAYVHVIGAVLDGNVCMDGTFDGDVCTLCNDVQNATYYAAAGHHTADEDWDVIAAPTKDTVGKIAGVCTVCEEEHEIELPKLTDEVYDHYVPTCQTVDTEDQEVYALTDYYGFSTEFKFNYEVSHRTVVGGDDVFFFEYDPTAENPAKYEYTALGLGADVFSGGEIPNCQTAKIAEVTCADCDTFIAVYATGEHKYDAEPDKDAEGNVITKAATCTETGYKAIYTCTAGCGNTKVLPEDVTPALGHKLVKNGDYVFDAEDETIVTVPVKCERCDYTGTITGQITDSAEATCQTLAYKTIKYTIEGQEVVETIYEGVLAPHYVVPAEDAEPVDVIEGETYEYTVLGLTAADFSGGQIPDCKTSKIAKVHCEKCNTFIAVFATGEHKYDVEPDKDAEGNVIKKAATCTETGYKAIYTCTAEGCGNTKVLPEDVTPVLGHKLVKNGDYVFDADNETIVTVPVKCERCDYTGTITGQITDSKGATCQTLAYKTIKYTIEGQEVVETIYEGELLPHHVVVGQETVDIFEEGRYTFVELGLTAADFSGGQIPDCKTAKIAKVYCADCDTFIAVFATGEHKFNTTPDKDAEGNVIKLAPTCTEDGYNAIYTCTAGCGEYKILDADVVEATGHAWVAEVVDGTISLTCDNCGETATGIIDEIVTVEAECGKEGSITYYYYETEADKEAEENRKSAEVVLEALDHDFEEAHEIEFEMEIGDKVYTCKAKLCNNGCDMYYIYEKVEKAA